MIRLGSRLSGRLAEADRRLAARLRRHGHGEDGFVLLETLIAISLIILVMAAFNTFFVGAITSTNHQRATQAAVQIADSSMEQIRTLPISDLLLGHDASSVSAQFNNAPASIQSSLSQMTQGVDPTVPVPATGTGLTAKVPTGTVAQTVNSISYGVNDYLGSCVIPATGSTACGVGLASAGTSYLRALVSVTWRDSTCQAPKATCIYTTSTLLSQGAESCFYFFQSSLAQLAVTDPGAQRWTIGTTRNLQLAAVPSAGTGNFQWSITAGALPAGLALSPAGLISGSPTTSAGPISVTVSVTDACSRTATRTFSWNVVAAPTISPTNQTTPINTPVTYAVPNTCPNTPCTFRAVNLPVGLTINPGTGVISGTATIPGTVTVTVSVTDNDGLAATASFTWSVVSPASTCVQSIALPNGGFETPVRSPGADTNWLHGNGVTPGVLWNTTAPDNNIEYWHNGGNVQDANGGLAIAAQDGDQWAELNANGVGALYQDLTTVPGQVLQWSVYHRARGVNGNTTGKDVMQVQIGSSASQSPQVPTGQATADISDGPLAWVRYTGVYTVPAGQTVTRFQFAAISTSTGNQTVGNFIDNLALNNNIACLVNPLVDQASTVNTPIVPLSIQVDRGTGPFVWTGGDTLPAGLVLSADGRITGTPTAAGSTPVILAFTDATAFTQTVSFNWTVYPRPTITTPTNQTHSVGAPVTLSLVSFCPNAPCTYALNNGPPGLTVTSGGVVTGTISGSAQVFGAVTVTVTDFAGATATTGNLTWTVLAAPTISTPAAQSTTFGASVNLAVTSTCANSPCTFTLVNAPPGLSISNTGVITGSPTLTGTYAAVTVTITDVDGSRATTANFTWTVASLPTIATPATQTTTVGAAVSLTVASSCLNTPCAFTLTNAPTGLSINSSGVISGTVQATTQVYSNVTVRVTDKALVSATTAPFTWNIVAKPTISALGTQIDSVGSPVTRTLTKTCPNAPCSYVLNNGPPGLSVTSAGVITGTISGAAQGYPTVSVTITDNSNVSVTSASFVWTVLAAPTIVTPAAQTSTLGGTVNLTVQSTCADQPCTFSLANAPPGLTINVSSGVISGSPTLTGTYATVTVTITDVDGSTATTANFTWTVQSAPTVTKPAPQTSTIGTAVNLPVVSTCGNTPCVFTMTGAPPGLSINASTGVITGIPTTLGTYPAVSVTITDKSPVSASTGSFTWTVVSGPSLTKPAAQTTTVGAVVNLTLTKSCPNAPCSYALNNGPAGLTISGAGVITGTVTSPAQVFNNASITITDNSGATANSGIFSWTVVARPTVTAPANQTDSIGSPVNLTLSKSCPNVPCSYVLNNGPDGLSVTSAGVVTGTITGSAQVYNNVTITVTDNSAISANGAVFTWTVVAAPTVTTPATQTTTVGAAVGLTVGSTCADAPCTFTLANAPPGLSISSSGVITGNITGPAQAYNSVRVTITDVDGSTDTTANFTWNVLAAPTVTKPAAQGTTTGASVNLTLATTCANSPCSYVLNNGPAGLTINAAGVITGTVTSAAQVFSAASVTVTDNSGITANTGSFTWTVFAAPTITTPAAQTTNAGATVALTVANTCPNTPCAFTLANAPSGLSINSSGVITGTVAGPAQVFNNVTVTVTDNSGIFARTASFTWTVRSSSIGTLANPIWSVSKSSTGATAVTYTYSYKTATTGNNLSSVSMSVPSGTAGTPVATVSGFTAANSSTTLSGNVLTVSFTPIFVNAGTTVSISITGMTNTNTVGTYTSQVVTNGQVNGGAIVALDSGTAGPISFTLGTLVNPVWSVSSSTTNATAVAYSYGFNTATAATLSSVTMTVPPGTTGTPAATVTGLPAGTIFLSGTVLTYTITNPVLIAAGTQVSLKVTGMTNTNLVATFTSQVVTNVTTSGATVPSNSGVTGPVSFTSNALVNPVWSVSTATTGARATYTYSFITATLANPLASVTMTVPPGTALGTNPTVAVAAASATGAVVALPGARLSLSGSVLTVSFDPTYIPSGTNITITVTGMTNTTVVGTYNGQMVTNGALNGGTIIPIDSAPIGPISITTGATLTNAVWQVSNSTIGARPATYTFRFTTATTATLSSVTLDVPPGTAGTPVAVVTGLSAGAISLTGGVLTYTLANPTSVNAGVAVSITVSGLTNTSAVDSYLAQLVTFTTASGGASVPNDSVSSGPIAFTAGTLGNPTWSASRTNAGATGVTYNFGFTVATTGNPLTTLTLTVPPGTGGNPAVSIPGLNGAAISLSGTLLTVTAGAGQYVPAGTAVTITVTGLTNTTVTGSYTSQLVTQGSPPAGGAVNQLDSASTAPIVIS